MPSITALHQPHPLILERSAHDSIRPQLETVEPAGWEAQLAGSHTQTSHSGAVATELSGIGPSATPSMAWLVVAHQPQCFCWMSEHSLIELQSGQSEGSEIHSPGEHSSVAGPESVPSMATNSSRHQPQSGVMSEHLEIPWHSV